MISEHQSLHCDSRFSIPANTRALSSLNLASVARTQRPREVADLRVHHPSCRRHRVVVNARVGDEIWESDVVLAAIRHVHYLNPERRSYGRTWHEIAVLLETQDVRHSIVLKGLGSRLCLLASSTQQRRRHLGPVTICR